MAKYVTGTREEWLAARLELLKAEKEYSRQGDELTRQRQELPWVLVDKQYRFETDEGSASLKDLCQGRSQLLIYHFMFGSDWTAGCPSCSMIADAFNGSAIHLANHDVMLWAVSRAPLPKLQAYKQRMGWTFPWASSFGGDFNSDFNVLDDRRTTAGGSRVQLQSRATGKRGISVARWSGGRWRLGRGEPSCRLRHRRAFVSSGQTRHERVRTKQDGMVYHTYSTYARGVDPFFGVYHWLDRAPKGRNEAGVWWRRHDEYDNQPRKVTNS
jgi:predicted dithiol-disulfide oxidoreductase (DUF899 family)